MKKQTKTFLSVVALVAVSGLFAAYLIGKSSLSDSNKQLSNNTNGKVAGVTTQNNGDYLNRLAKHLAQSGLVLYGSYNSAECLGQQNLFGDSIQYLNYVECDSTRSDANTEECLGQKIDIYPTWIYQGEKHTGIQSLADLAKLSGFTE